VQARSVCDDRGNRGRPGSRRPRAALRWALGHAVSVISPRATARGQGGAAVSRERVRSAKEGVTSLVYHDRRRTAFSVAPCVLFPSLPWYVTRFAWLRGLKLLTAAGTVIAVSLIRALFYPVPPRVRMLLDEPLTKGRRLLLSMNR